MLTVLTVVVLVGAGIAVVLGVQARSSADDTRTRTVALQRDRRESATRQEAADHTIDSINTAVAKIPPTFNILGQTLDKVVTAQNNVVDTHNRGARAPQRRQRGPGQPPSTPATARQQSPTSTPRPRPQGPRWRTPLPRRTSSRRL